MSVVSNASPLISLARLGSLELLHELFGEIHIAPEVFHEVAVARAGRPAAAVVRSVPWIRVQACSDTARLQSWRQEHGFGRGRTRHDSSRSG